MFKIAKPFFIQTITSLHAGSGDSLGIVDLPIQRERHTSFPKIESSSLKGSLREALENLSDTTKKKFIDETVTKLVNGEINKVNFKEENEKMNFDYAIHLVFGYDEDGVNKDIENKFKDDTEFSGCLAFTDARLLLFPVKSMKGVFAWITCPYVLQRFKDDMKIIGNDISIGIENLKPEIGKCITAHEKFLVVNNNVILEEYSFNKEKTDSAVVSELLKYINNDEISKRLVILSDDDFKDFVNHSTEVITRTKIDNETGTVKSGALFNEEYLPPETIMYFLVFASPVFQKDENKKGIFKQNGKSEEELVLEFFDKGLPEYIQIGGNATIGKGIVRTKLMEV